jgi:hypothetical protein
MRSTMILRYLWPVPCLVILALSVINQLNHRLSSMLDGYPSQPTNYMKNEHTQQKVTVSGRDYHYAYTFADGRSTRRTWQWTSDKKATDVVIDRYGLPFTILEPYLNTPLVRRMRVQTIGRGLFRTSGTELRPNYSRIMIVSLPVMRPLHALIRQRLEADHLNWYEIANLVLAFCQDIPYGVPPDYNRNRITAGLLSPPECLVLGYGDCDTKALLLASLLAFHPDHQLLFVHVPKHLFVAVAGIPRPYDRYLTYAGRQWILCEPAGPGRLPFGMAKESFDAITDMDAIRMTQTLRQSLLDQPCSSAYSDTPAPDTKTGQGD